jgi:predicted RNA-binding protein with PIN domain
VADLEPSRLEKRSGSTAQTEAAKPAPPDDGTASGALVVLVDAENVRRSQWPNLSKSELVERCRAWAAAKGLNALVVFDGSPPDGGTAEHDVDDRVAVAGSGAESADDWLVRRAGELHDEGVSFWLVTSDRALRAEAGRHAEWSIGGGSFLQEL